MALRSARGSALIVLLALAPGIMALITAIVGVVNLFFYHDRWIHGCRSELLAAHAEVRDAWDGLEALNPEAQSLRARKATAETALAAALAAGQIAAADQARRQLKVIHGEQVNLGRRQGLRLNFLRRVAERGQARFRDRFRSKPGLNLTRAPRLMPDFITRPAESLTPDYILAVRENLASSATAVWRLQAADHVPIWIRKAVSSFHSWEGTCSTLIDRAGDRWRVRLNGDNA